MQWAIGPGGRLRLLGAAAIALVFVAGGLAGAAFERVVITDSPAESVDEREPEPCRRRESQEERQLRPYRDLGLSKEQKGEIISVLERRRQQLEALWSPQRPPMDSIIDRARDEINAVLTPEQEAEMDRRRAARRQRDSIRREEYRRRCGDDNARSEPRDGRGHP